MKSGIALLTVIFAVSGLVQAQTEPGTQTQSVFSFPLDLNGILGSVGSVVSSKPRLTLGQRVILNETATTRIYDKLDGKVQDQRVILSAETELEVLAVSADGKVAEVGIDTDDATFSDLFVSVEDIEAANIARVEEVADAEDEDVVDDGQFAGRRKKGGMTYCYRDVKTTLLKAKKCGRYASGVRAEMGYKILQSECGMKPAKLKSFSKLGGLPPYSVCVSSGGRPCGGGKSCGHIAIKKPNGMWFGAGTRGTPWLPDSKKRGYKPRKIVGCLLPKGAK